MGGVTHSEAAPKRRLKSERTLRPRGRAPGAGTLK